MPLRRSLWACATGAAVAGLLAAGCGSTPARGSASRPTTPSTSHSETTSPPVSAGGPTTTTTPSEASGDALLGSVLRDARAEQWVHTTIRSPLSAADGGGGQLLVNVSGPTNGSQQITLGPVSGSVLVVGATTYVKGSAAALAELFQVPVDAAADLAGQWVTLKSTDTQYTSVTAGVILSSVLQETVPTDPVTMSRATFEGQPVIALSGRGQAGAGLAKSTVTLYVTGGAKPLPVGTKVTASGTAPSTTTFTDWGQVAAIATPPNPVPLPLEAPPGTSTL